MNWEAVRFYVRCAFGCDIPKGELGLFGRRRFVLCRSCARRRYSMRPPRKMLGRQHVDLSDTVDGKLRQMPAGDE